jgi:hypothetical protein
VPELELEHGFDAWTLYSEWEPVALSSPAAGAGLTYTVPGSTQVEVLSASFTYTASANAANRIPFLSFLDQSGVAVGSFGTPYKLVANDASRVSFGVYVSSFGADSAARIGSGIPPMRLASGMQVLLSATAINVSDQISTARLYVRQWRVRE